MGNKNNRPGSGTTLSSSSSTSSSYPTRPNVRYPTPSDSTITNANIVNYQPSSSLQRGLCSQAECHNYADSGNYLGLCSQCYRKYRDILNIDASEIPVSVTGNRSGLPNSSSYSRSRTSQDSERGLFNGRPVTKASSGVTLTFPSSLEYPRQSACDTPSRTTGTSSTRTAGTGTAVPGSFTEAVYHPLTTGSTYKKSTGTIPNTTRTNGTTYTPTLGTPASHYTARTIGTTYTRPLHTPASYSTTMTTSNTYSTTLGTTASNSYGTTVSGRGYDVHNGTSQVYTSTQQYAGARPKQYQANYPPKKLTRINLTEVAAVLNVRDKNALMDFLSLSNADYDRYCSSSVKDNPLLSVLVAWKRKSGVVRGEFETCEELMKVLELFNEKDAISILSGQKAINQSKPKSCIDAVVKSKEPTTISSVDASTSLGSDKRESTGKQTSKKASQGKIVKTMRDNLLCPICLDLLADAKTLPCQHVICKECLVQWVASKGELRCPTCNTRQPTPPGGVEGLPSNFMLNNLVAEMKKLDTQEIGAVEEAELDVDKEPVISSTTPAAAASIKSLLDFSPGVNDWKKIPVAQTTFLEILGNQFKAKGSTVKLKLQFCDVEGEPIRGESKAGIAASIQCPNGETVPVSNISFLKKFGNFTMSFPAEEIGIHLVEVTLEGKPVVGSPTKIVIRPNGKMDLTLSPRMQSPKGIAVLSSEIYITDESNNVYLKTDWKDSRWLDDIDKPDHKEYTQLTPFGIAKSNEKIFITDMCNSCVYVYANNEYMNNFGKRVLEQPTGIAVSTCGIIYVADCGANTIDVFRPNYSHSHSIDVKGKGSLTHLVLNQAEDRIIVVDDKTNLIKIVDVNSSKMIKSIKPRINQAPATPFGVTIDDDDNIYVSVTFDPAKLTRGKGAARNGDVRHKGAIITYTSYGYYLGTIGERELINPRGICWVDDPAPQLLVLEAGDDESQSQCIKIFRL